MRLLTTFKLMKKRLQRIASVRLGSPAAADDVLQEVWLKLSRVDDGSEIENPCGFVRTVFNNAVTSWQRQEARRAAIDRDIHATHWASEDTRTPERIIIARDLLAALADALDTLPERTRAIFIAHRLEGRPRRLIARDHAISEEAVHYHIHRAAAQLAHIREETEGES